MNVLDLLDFLKLYLNADPETKEAIRLILEAEKPHPGSRE
jgi:hypothetical protein